MTLNSLDGVELEFLTGDGPLAARPEDGDNPRAVLPSEIPGEYDQKSKNTIQGSHKTFHEAENIGNRFQKGVVSFRFVRGHWTQQDTLRKLVNDWRKINAPAGKRLAPLSALAPHLQVTLRTLSTYLSPSCRSTPSRDFRERAALFFGVPRALLDEDPFAELPGLDPSGLSPLKRAAASRIMAVFNSPSLTDDYAIELAHRFGDFLEFVVRVKESPRPDPTDNNGRK